MVVTTYEETPCVSHILVTNSATIGFKQIKIFITKYLRLYKTYLTLYWIFLVLFSLMYSSSELSSNVCANLLLQSSSSKQHCCQIIRIVNSQVNKWIASVYITSCKVIMSICARLSTASITTRSNSWHGLQKINSYLRISQSFSDLWIRGSLDTVILFWAIAIGSLICDCNSAYKAVTGSMTRNVRRLSRSRLNADPYLLYYP